jgi:methylenetetrahydrofolate reductase (NADPH)
VDVQLPGALNGTWTREESMQMEAEDYISVSPQSEAGILPLLQSAGLKAVLGAKLRQKANLLKETILDPQVFCVTWEQIPGRGAFEIQQEKVFENVVRAAAGGKVHAISVTDNPGGNPALSTEMLCAQIKKANMEPLVHLACRDKNRNEMESMLYGVAAEGVRNILVLSGDYPSAEAFGGTPKPVYDLDPVNALRLVQEMNGGLEQNISGKTIRLAQTDFFAGACANPFKIREAELIPQYAKLRKKIQSGAGFLITQIGYDARKLHELLQWLKVNGYSIPVLFNVYVLPYGAAKTMNANGVAGCVVTDKLLAEIEREKESADKGKSARLLRAAKQYAIAKGMGCAGAHVGGHGVTYDMVESIIDQGEELSRDWEKLLPEFDYPQKGGFYFFQKEESTGLNAAEPAARSSRARVPLVYRLSRLAHAVLFNEKSVMFRILRPVAARVDASRRARQAFGWWEHMAKTAMFSCQNCGDCALFDVAYICPMTQCPKQQRNGPCGGSYGGFCEKYPGERECIWVQAYDRLKEFGEEGAIEDHIVPPCNWRLSDSSSWLNFYLGRDHTAIRLGIAAPEPRVRGKKRGRREASRQAPSNQSS